MRKGRYIATPFFLFKYQKSPLRQGRIGFVVSGKVSRKAVDRNKLKRRLREITRTSPAFLSCHYDAVLIARKPILTLAFPELRENLFNIFERLKK